MICEGRIQAQAGERGFSLVGMLMAMVITMVVGLSAFQLFVQNERVFRDQNLILDMHQGVRAVASMMADELRMSRQGVPAYAASLEGNTQEGSQTFLNGSDASTVRFRSSIHSASALVQNTLPLSYTIGSTAVLSVDDADAVFALVGTETTRFVYMWGPSASAWTWLRARITSVNPITDTITVVPAQMSSLGGLIDWDPYLVVEEAVAYRLNGTDVERATSNDFTAMTAPGLAYEVVGENFTGLTFTYYDASDNVVNPTSLANRSLIRRVDFTLSAQTAEPLASTGNMGTYAVSMSVYPRNVALY
jgi:hypothetical protein